MKIQSSSIVMGSAHEENSYTYKESMTMEVAKSKNAVGAILTISKEAEGKSVKDAMVDYQTQQKEDAKKRQQENDQRALEKMAENIRTNNKVNNYAIPRDDNMEIKMLRKMLEILRGKKLTDKDMMSPSQNGGVLDLRSAQYKNMESIAFGASASASASASISFGSLSIGGTKAGTSGNGEVSSSAASAKLEAGTTGVGTTWQRITASSGFRTETESTTFASTGIVKTADGRSIDFNVEVSMSRAYMEKCDMLEVQEYIKTDPLMINLDTNIGSVSDQKFFFDLDSDGKEEEISFAGKDSGFLAWDKNGDGKINDGSELFGTKSGDGFKDLAEYDEDGNGWIDENDSIYSRLKVWTKDENGNDRLIDLKDADVGAIYLRNADTQFSLKNDENKLNAEIKKTGIYLKESTGAVGTLNHVDLVV